MRQAKPSLNACRGRISRKIIKGWNVMNEASELLVKLPNGLPAVSSYSEFLRITNQADTPEAFVMWSQAAFTLMQPAQGRA